MKKEDAILVLNGLLNSDNKNKVESYIEKIESMTDEQWRYFLNQKSIDSIEGIEKLANQLLARTNDDEKIKLNDLVSYGISGNTLHVHVVPKDLHHMLSRKGLKDGEQYLIDALEQIKELLKSEEYGYIDKVFAVSPIMRRPISDIFKGLGFSTRTINMNEAEHDEELQYFYEMFKGQGKK